MSGPSYWYEDFTPGREFAHAPRAVTAEEIIEFAREFDPQPFHLSEEAGKASILGGLCASGWHTCSITMRQFYDSILQHTASEGAPGIDVCEWRRPLMAGDSVSGTTTVVDRRPMRSRPGIGLLHFKHTIVNQKGEMVMFMEHPAMVRMRPEVAA